MASAKFPQEVILIEKLVQEFKEQARAEVLGYSQDVDLKVPIYKITMGSTSPQAPVLGLIGGVHGLERIGSQVCLALLNSLAHLSLWDRGTQTLLEQVRVFFIPTVNPIGILKKRRSNPNGVDLMRNAPVEAEEKIPFLLGGQRYSANLPWFRGQTDKLEPEAQYLIDAVKAEISNSPAAVTLDLHSGFGLQDQIWFPYAKARRPIPDLHFLHAFMDLMESTYPHHFYKIEPQAYLTHGDIWDYLYDWNQDNENSGVFIPLCLEMGSWNWVKKNPIQIFYPEGTFFPMKPHRHKRILRRHNTLFEFLLRSLFSYERWVHLSEEQKNKHQTRAIELWYNKGRK